MRLINKIAREDDEDDYAYQIAEEGGEEYLSRILAVIEDDKGKAIGELTGYVLFPNEILINEISSFFVMDGISQLLCNAHGFLVGNKRELFQQSSILFLNRLSLYEQNNEVEENILNMLLKLYGTIIYSFGATELGDKDFFDHQDDTYFNYWEERLNNTSWVLNKTFNLYYKRKNNVVPFSKTKK